MNDINPHVKNQQNKVTKLILSLLDSISLVPTTHNPK